MRFQQALVLQGSTQEHGLTTGQHSVHAVLDHEPQLISAMLCFGSRSCAPVGGLDLAHEVQVLGEDSQPQSRRIVRAQDAQPSQAVQEGHKAGFVPGT